MNPNGFVSRPGPILHDSALDTETNESKWHLLLLSSHLGRAQLTPVLAKNCFFRVVKLTRCKLTLCFITTFEGSSLSTDSGECPRIDLALLKKAKMQTTVIRTLTTNLPLLLRT